MQFTEFFTVRDVDNLEPIVDSSLTKSAPVSLVDKDGAVDSAPSNEPALETDTEPTIISFPNSAYNVEPSFQPQVVSASHWKPAGSSDPPPPGFVPPPAFASQLFYENVKNAQPQQPVPLQTSGVTRGANPYVDTHDASSPPLAPMSAPPDPRGADSPQPRPPPSPAQVSPVSAPREARQATSHRSFHGQSFPSPSFYPPRSTSVSEPPYPAPGAYAQGPSPGPGYMGQYMLAQPPHSMAPRAFAYSQPFAPPGAHAPDLSNLDIPFDESRDARSGQGYAPAAPLPFVPSPNASHLAPTHTTPGSSHHLSHQTYTPLHFSPAPSGPHFHGHSTHSYAHPPPGLYSFAPSPYQQPYYTQPTTTPEGSSKASPWWYAGPGPVGGQQYESSLYRGGFYQAPMQVNHPVYDPYSPLGAGSPSSAFPGSSSQAQLPQQPQIRLPPHEPVVQPTSPVPPQSGPSNSSFGTGVGAPPPVSLTLPARSPLSSPTSLRKMDTPGSPSSPHPASRKSYHPNPPANRSEWVMWVGNVPSDATSEELWNFFNQAAPTQSLSPGTTISPTSRHVQSHPFATKDEKVTRDVDMWGGVSSVFIITRSNCAFVNFDTEAHLECAVAHFNGKPLRPKDSRCPRLVCRVRRRDDDLRAGVGGQRGMGFHTRWVVEQKERERERALKAETEGQTDDSEAAKEEHENIHGPPTSPSIHLAASRSSHPSPSIPAVSPIEDLSSTANSPTRGSQGDRDVPRHGSSGDRSFASTNSSFLSAHFPRRYFILKSLTQHDLNLSLERGIWATQPHNEGILDQAFRTSLDVYLVFGANKSGEFFGYARMAGPVFHSDQVDHVSWASRSSVLSAGHHGSSPPEVIAEEDESDKVFLFPDENRLVGESPAPVTPEQEARLRLQISLDSHTSRPKGQISTPAEPYQPHRRISRPTISREADTFPGPPRKAGETFDLPKAMSDGHQAASRLPLPRGADVDTNPVADDNADDSMLQKDTDGVLRVDTYGSDSELRRLHDNRAAFATSVARGPESLKEQENPEDSGEGKPDGWGREFKIEWLRTERLPFHRTRHLRNPWNHDREVKVSRDGTELEPSVGQRLLDEWDALPPQAKESPTTSPSPLRGRGSRVPLKVGTGGSAASSPSIPFLSSQLYSTNINDDGVGRGGLRGAGQP